MILRVYRAKAVATSRDALLDHLRDTVYPANVRTPGLRTFQAGLRDLSRGRLEIALVSTWQDFEALRAGIGEDWLRPPWLTGIADVLQPVDADHYELVGEELTGIVPLAGGALRILAGALASGHGGTFFDFARETQAAQLDSGDILVSHIGRRIVEDREEAAYVTVWRDPDAPAAAGGSPTSPANRGQWENFFAHWTFGAYDALARVAPRRGEETVLLLADDERRYLFATPAAGRLLGRAPARILGRRVEEVTGPSDRDRVEELWRAFLRDGVQAGPFELTRADGSTITMRYEAHANTPWPGVHASVLADPAKPLDFDEALASAGLVARYAMASAS